MINNLINDKTTFHHFATKMEEKNQKETAVRKIQKAFRRK